MNLLQLWQQQFLCPCHGKSPFLGSRRETPTKGMAGGCVPGNPWECGNPWENGISPGLDGLAGAEGGTHRDQRSHGISCRENYISNLVEEQTLFLLITNIRLIFHLECFRFRD